MSPINLLSKRFFEKSRYIPQEIREEDLKLWKRSIDRHRFYICDQYLIRYRIHNNQVTSDLRKKDTLQEPIIGHVVEENFNFELCCGCGYPKDRLRFNFCQKCNRLYK